MRISTRLKRLAGTKSLLGALLIVIALIVLPTGTPEDGITSFVLVKYLGLDNFIRLCLVMLLLLVYWKASKK